MDFHSFYCCSVMPGCVASIANSILRGIWCKSWKTQFDVADVEVGRSDEAIEMIVAIRAQAQLFDDILAGHATELSIESIAQMIDGLEVAEHLLEVNPQEAQNNAFLNNARITQEVAQWHAWCHARILELWAQLKTVEP
jgi:hypothetical protein